MLRTRAFSPLSFLPLAMFAVCAGLSAQPASGPASKQASSGQTGLIELQIPPSRTDPEIKTFDQPHVIWVNRDIVVDRKPDLPAARSQLLLFLPGTVPPTAEAAPVPSPGAAAPKKAPTGRPGPVAFCELAANLGYHVILLKYPNEKSASAAARDEDVAEFERFRMAIIAGGASKHITIARNESIEHRLIKLLQQLQRARPREDWKQFLTDAGDIKWRAIAVAGQSQGGGHAALIAKKHEVARVIATGAPKDYSLRHRKPAAWLTASSATPPSRIFCFNHVQDRQAANLEQQRENLRALQLDKVAPEVNVDTATPPYSHSRMLFTDFPGGKELSSREAHTAVISSRNVKTFEPVWRYMLTEEVK
ncbi:MAG: hypothetical protein V4773_25075 [Verrucomicrobiota bacterium]